MPILDAFNGPLRPANRWLPQLPWNNNFRQVARFDRCETCHQGMERSLPGEPTEPAFPPIHRVHDRIADAGQSPGRADATTLESVYGIRLENTGMFDASDVTVRAVYPDSPRPPRPA